MTKKDETVSPEPEPFVFPKIEWDEDNTHDLHAGIAKANKPQK